MKIALFSARKYDRDFFDRANAALRAPHDIVYIEASLGAETAAIVRGRGFKCVCVFVNDTLDAATLEILAAEGIQLIALRCAGFNNVDLNAAGALGLRIVRVPAYSPHAVAEHALALLLTLNRKTHKAYNRVREGDFSLDGLVGFDLCGRTVGVIGTGTIGSVFAGMMVALGCRVIAYDPQRNTALAEAGVEYRPLDELWPAADIVSIHCPLTPETKHLINADSVARMKPGVVLINTGRGAIIDTRAVIAALKSRHVGALGIDVYEQEEGLFFVNHGEDILQDDQIARLLTFPNVLVTGHQAFLTKEALYQIARVTLSSIEEFETGTALTNEVTQAR
ncbi:MAG: 2-hydroxyacid dehydrogenase [bacterium]|nr:2-hydroxyacid dehydrogenase [bacterium]